MSGTTSNLGFSQWIPSRLRARQVDPAPLTLEEARGPIPHLKKAIGAVEPYAIAEHGRVLLFPRLRRREHGIFRRIFGQMLDAGERGFLDEEIVHEKLAAQIDRDDGGRRRDVGRDGGRCARDFERRRPCGGGCDAIVGRGGAGLRAGLREKRERQEGGEQFWDVGHGGTLALELDDEFHEGAGELGDLRGFAFVFQVAGLEGFVGGGDRDLIG